MKISAVAAIILVLTLAAFAPAERAGESDSPLGFRVSDIDGKAVDLGDYRGKVVLIVNTASKCGLTPQYEALEAIYNRYRDRGFTILAFPANSFGGQEPGTNAEIKAFCQTNYSITFPIFAKSSVKGDDISPLYAWLTSAETNPGYSGEIPWNFTKFLVDRDGRLAARFAPKIKPDSEEVTGAIEQALAAR